MAPLFADSPLQKHIHGLLSAVDTHGQAVYMSVRPAVSKGPDIITLMCLRKGDGSFPETPQYEKYLLPLRAYEVFPSDPHCDHVKDALHEVQVFINAVEEALQGACP